MNIALIDMDGTLCDYQSTIEKKIDDITNGRQFDIDKKAIADIIKKLPGFWRTLPKIELGFKIAEMLKANNFDLHILTKGPYKTTSAWTEKVEWCREHLPGVPVTITEDKGLVYGKILVDDWPEYCEKWLRWRPRGVVIMPAYPYNEGFDEKYPGQVVRATLENLDEIEAVIKRVANRKSGEAL